MEPPPPADTPAPPPASAPPATVYRHRVTTRLWHWLNAIAILIMIGSGIGILNAHPRLYWGDYGANMDHAWLDLRPYQGFMRSGWFTIPMNYNLAISRRWHLLFALVLAFGLLAFMVASLINRHFQRDLRVRAKEIAPRHLIDDAVAHAKFDFHNHDDPAAYNTLQKLSYVATIFVLIPVMILSGLTLSPGMDAAWPWLLDLFGGRQSARSVHFLAAALLAGFTVVHLALVILAGAANELRSMLTGWWRVPR